MPKSMFENKVTNLSKKTQGTLIIKEYPTATAHSGHFKSLLNGLHLRSHLDLILFSLITLIYVLPHDIAGNLSVNSYSYIIIAEGFEGCQVETNVPIVFATQTTRSGYGASDVTTDTSESFGLPATADLMFALINTEELESLKADNG